MDDDQLLKSVQRGKRFNLICLAILGIVLLSIIFFAISLVTRPISSSITVSAAKNVLSNGCFDVKIEGINYEVNGNSDFVSLFELDKWILCEPFDRGGKYITLHFAELYELYIFDNGTAVFYDGYCASGKKEKAFYDIPSDIYMRVIECSTRQGVQDKGTVNVG